MTDLEIAVTLFLVGGTAIFSYNQGAYYARNKLISMLLERDLIRLVKTEDGNHLEPGKGKPEY